MKWCAVACFPLVLLVVGAVMPDSDYKLNQDQSDDDILLLSKKAWKDIHPVWGKRCWDCLEDNLDKRGWERLHTGWGKRSRSESPWNDQKSPDWQKFRGTWGKKNDFSGWKNLKGAWGKRSLENKEITTKQD